MSPFNGSNFNAFRLAIESVVRHNFEYEPNTFFLCIAQTFEQRHSRLNIPVSKIKYLIEKLVRK